MLFIQTHLLLHPYLYLWIFVDFWFFIKLCLEYIRGERTGSLSVSSGCVTKSFKTQWFKQQWCYPSCVCSLVGPACAWLGLASSSRLDLRLLHISWTAGLAGTCFSHGNDTVPDARRRAQIHIASLCLYHIHKHVVGQTESQGQTQHPRCRKGTWVLGCIVTGQSAQQDRAEKSWGNKAAL